MNLSEAKELIDYTNRWRRGADIPQPDPKKLGEALDIASLALGSIDDLSRILRDIGWPKRGDNRTLQDFATEIHNKYHFLEP